MSLVEDTTTMFYRDDSRTIKDRVSYLLSEMSLEEKVAQMVCIWNDRHELLFDDDGHLDPNKVAENFPYGLGQIGRPGDADKGAVAGSTPTEMAELTNEIQRAVIANNRLGIPVMFHDECLHGLMAVHATSFPSLSVSLLLLILS